MTDPRTRFDALAAEIDAHPLLELTAYEPAPPAVPRVLAAAADRLDGTLAPAIRRFYEQCDGLRLEWRPLQNLSDAEMSAMAERFDDYAIEWPDSDYLPFARIHLLPLEESILRDDWETDLLFVDDLDPDATIPFRGAGYSVADFTRRIKPFDLFGGDMGMAFFLEDAAADPPVVYLSSLLEAAWQDARVTDFATYLEVLFATRGVVEARDRLFAAEDGADRPPLIAGADYFRAEVPTPGGDVVTLVPRLFREG